MTCNRKPRINSWTAEEEQRLRDIYPNTRGRELADIFGRTHKAINSRAKILGIKKNNRHTWTSEEDNLISQLYANTLTQEIADQLGLCISAVYNRAHTLGFKKSLAYQQSLEVKNQLAVHGAKYRFKKGQASHNKGCSQPSHPNSTLHQFKPGQKPKNWLPIGSVRVMGTYQQVKLTDTGYPPRDWVGLQILIWQRLHGRNLQRNELVVFRDRNPRNFAYENLEQIDRREQMRRNTIHNYPKEIALAVQLRGQITRQINKRKKA